MTLSKSDLVKSLTESIRQKRRKKKGQQFLFPEMNYDRLSLKKARSYIDSLFDIIGNRLENDENVLIRGFGRFNVKFKWARKGRHPRTGEPIVLESRRSVTFHCSPTLKKKINSTKD